MPTPLPVLYHPQKAVILREARSAQSKHPDELTLTSPALTFSTRMFGSGFSR